MSDGAASLPPEHFAKRAPEQAGGDAANMREPVHLTLDGARALSWAMDTLRAEGRLYSGESVAHFFANIFAEIAPHVSTAMMGEGRLRHRTLRDGPVERFEREAS
jgi:hypothetical protein